MKTTVKILQTKNYDQFKMISGNRPVDINHVNHLVSLNSQENLLWMFPATVTKDNYLFDGQHRLEACRANDWDFYYIVSDKTLAELGDTIVALTNTAQKRWNLIDFIHYYVLHKKEQYIFLQQLLDTYGMTHSNILTLASGASQAKAIKRGELKLFSTDEDKQIIIDMLEGYKLLKDIVPYNVWIHRSFVASLRTVFGNMSAEELKSEIVRSNAILERKINSTEYLRELENVVNYRRSEKNYTRFF